MGTKQDDHNRGEQDGSKADGLEQWIQTNNPFTSTEYKEGFRHGANNQSEKSDDDKSSDSDSSSSSSGSDSSSSCFISSSCIQAVGLPDNCRELRELRTFRDNILSESADGRSKINQYYRMAPAIVKNIESRANPIQIYQAIYIHMVAPVVTLIESGLSKDAVSLYEKRVNQLEAALYD